MLFVIKLILKILNPMIIIIMGGHIQGLKSILPETEKREKGMLK